MYSTILSIYNLRSQGSNAYIEGRRVTPSVMSTYCSPHSYKNLTLYLADSRRSYRVDPVFLYFNPEYPFITCCIL